MTDQEFAERLGLSADEAAKIIPMMTPERRAALEQIAGLAMEIHLWEAGLGPKPTGAILCGPRQIRSAQ